MKLCDQLTAGVFPEQAYSNGHDTPHMYCDTIRKRDNDSTNTAYVFVVGVSSFYSCLCNKEEPKRAPDFEEPLCGLRCASILNSALTASQRRPKVDQKKQALIRQRYPNKPVTNIISNCSLAPV